MKFSAFKVFPIGVFHIHAQYKDRTNAEAREDPENK